MRRTVVRHARDCRAIIRKDHGLRYLRLSIILLAGCMSAGLCQSPPQGQASPTPPAPLKPGKDRWLVKTASDASANGVKRRPEKTSIEKLRTLPRPADYPLNSTPAKYQTERAGLAESSIYSVEADIVECRLMPDGDYHVVMRGASGETMVLEMPDPDPAFTSPSSPFAYAIRAAREQFESKVKPERAAKPLNLHARITGIGFFGRQYGKTPAKGNLLQLHPAVDFEWQDEPSAEFSADRAVALKAKDPRTNPPASAPGK